MKAGRRIMSRIVILVLIYHRHKILDRFGHCLLPVGQTFQISHPAGPGMLNDCAGEGQQQFTPATDGRAFMTLPIARLHVYRRIVRGLTKVELERI
jgi:hypothetical protein